MKNILITGCAGFIGSSFLKKIINKNIIVYGIDDLSTGTIKNLPRSKNFTFIKGDCGNKKILDKIKNKIDFIYHFAGQSSGEKSFYNPVDDVNRNLLTTINLLNFYIKKKSKQFIYASSMSVYGDLHQRGVNEKDSCKPISFYGLSKLTSEEYIKLFLKKKINYTILRLFNVYGPGQTTNNLKQGLIRIYLTQILKFKKLIVKGSLKRYRDFIYIDDVVSLLEIILNNKKSFTKTYNVSFGKKVFLSQLINLLKDKINFKFSVYENKGTPSDQFGIYSNSKKLKNEIDFSPRTNISTGIDNYLKYLKLS